MNDNKFLAQNQFLQQVLKPMITSEINKVQIPTYYYGTVKQIYSDNTADIEVWSGQATILEKLQNKSNNILSINDITLLCCPHGNMTDIYIDKCCNKEVKFDAEHVKGILRVGGLDNSDGAIVLMTDDGNAEAIQLKDYSIKFFDWQQEGTQVGEIGAYRHGTSSSTNYGSPVLDFVAEKNCSISLSCRSDNGTDADSGIEVSNNAYNDGKKIYVYREVNINPDSGNHGVDISDAGNQVYNHTHCNGWDIDNIGNLNAVNLTVSGSKNCVQSTQNYGDRLFYSYETTESYLGDVGSGKINNGECVISFDPIFIESVDISNYIVKFYPSESCNYKIEKYSTYFVVKADKDIEFDYEIMAHRKGFENDRLELANSLKSNLPQPTERNPFDKIK